MIKRRFQKRVIYADRHKLAQVIRNLLSNGLKFTPKGGSVTINITLSRLIKKKRKSINYYLLNIWPFTNGNRKTHDINDHSFTSKPQNIKRKTTPSSLSDLDVEISDTPILKIDVTDTGAGISKVNKAYLKHICISYIVFPTVCMYIVTLCIIFKYQILFFF